MVPLREDVPQRIYPDDSLPPVLREMVMGIAETTGTSVLSAVSYAFTGRYRIQGKPDHTEPPVIYSFTVTEPSERKSPVVKFIKKPFVDFEINYNKEHAEEF